MHKPKMTQQVADSVWGGVLDERMGNMEAKAHKARDMRYL